MTSTELIEEAEKFDGKKVIYAGELITTVMNRGSHSWINLHDGKNAIGVWCESAQLSGVKFAGDYKNTGDVIEAEGIFHRACPEHYGELDIHAVKAAITKEGFPREEDVNKRRATFSVAVFSALLLMIMIFRNRL